MWAGRRGRIHQSPTRRAGKLKLRATVGANGFPCAHPLTANRTQVLTTMLTGIVTQSNGAAATRALMGYLHRFVARGAAATPHHKQTPFTRKQASNPSALTRQLRELESPFPL